MAHTPGPMTLKRIHKELADLKKEDLGTITLAPMGDSLFDFIGSIPGPQGSIYDGGVFNVEVHLSHDYPFSAPKVLFKTRIFHMNISDHGAVCLDILKTNWSPALSLFKVMLSLSSLLTDPNPQDPLVPNIAQLYLRDRKSHDDTARKWTDLYATPKPPAPPPSSKAKGKQKAPALSSAVRTSSRTSTSSRPRTRAAASTVAILDEPITLSDSDSEPPLRRKRRGGPSDAAEVIELDDEDDEEANGSNSGTQRFNKRQRRDPPAPDHEVIELD